MKSLRVDFVKNVNLSPSAGNFIFGSFQVSKCPFWLYIFFRASRVYTSFFLIFNIVVWPWNTIDKGDQVPLNLVATIKYVRVMRLEYKSRCGQNCHLYSLSSKLHFWVFFKHHKVIFVYLGTTLTTDLVISCFGVV